MNSKIKIAFQKCKNEQRPALITYIVASDPNKKKSLEILKSISDQVDILEIGFSPNTYWVMEVKFKLAHIDRLRTVSKCKTYLASLKIIKKLKTQNQ